jgi:hypothetical protein
VLNPLSFAWVRVVDDGDAQSGGGEASFPFSHCLVQMPVSFPVSMETKDPTAMIQMSWWKPEDPEKGVSGKWVVWFKGKSQWVAQERRGVVEFTDVQVWGSSVLEGPLRSRWARVQAKSARVLPDTNNTK